MLRRRLLVSGLGLVASAAGCLLTTNLDGLTGGGDDGGPSPEASGGSDAEPDVGTDAGSEAGIDAGADADASSCTCTGLVSAYRFADPLALGHDFFGTNNMTTVHGSPKQSTVTPSGHTGHSIQLDGASSVCIDTGFTFDSTADHTLCWWSQPTALADSTNQFAQTCSYDTWTTSSGADYLWRINNCNNGTPANFQVPGVYTAGKWVQICQTYASAAMKRSVVIDGNTSKKSTITDTVPIVEPSTQSWCIGSYSGGGYWTGYVYLPLWFDRVLGDAEIQQVNATACCLP